jgi:hypothetical protein
MRFCFLNDLEYYYEKSHNANKKKNFLIELVFERAYT